METQSEIGAADDAWIVFGLEPARAQMHAACRQAREAPLEFRSALAVAGHQNDQVREPSRPRQRFPPADAILEPEHGVDDDVEVFVFGPARRTHDEAHERAVNARARQERLTVALTIGPVDRA